MILSFAQPAAAGDGGKISARHLMLGSPMSRRRPPPPARPRSWRHSSRKTYTRCSTCTILRCMSDVLDVRDLRMRYGKTDVLNGVSFAARRGEVLALLGPNGAGKTTTIEILEGFRMRSAGEVSVLGADPAHGFSAPGKVVRQRLLAVGRQPGSPELVVDLHAGRRHGGEPAMRGPLGAGRD